VDLKQPGAQAYYDSGFELFVAWGGGFCKGGWHCTPLSPGRNWGDPPGHCAPGRPMVL